MEIIAWIADNYELVVLVITLVIALLRTTKWGRANAEALDAVVGAIEQNQSRLIKRDVAQAQLSPDAMDALNDKVAKHDAKKDVPSEASVIARELAKTIGLRLAKRR